MVGTPDTATEDKLDMNIGTWLCSVDPIGEAEAAGTP